MAQHEEPMDIDSSVCDFDNKENSYRHNNVLPRTPCTEKGYEELDVSELNMKLRYSITPASSPMSKSYTANSIDNRTIEPENSTLDNENGNMTRSLHTTLTKHDKSQKSLPLQILSSDGQIVEMNRNILRPLDSSGTFDGNITVTVSGPNDIDENISIPSSGSSMAHTPEATTPTKEIPKGDAPSPIMRGLKSVLNMFRPSQSPIPPTEGEIGEKPEVLSPPIINSPETGDRSHVVSASTPLMSLKTKDPLSKRSSQNQNADSIVFNEDLEKELEWKDDTTIIFGKEKIPIHKLLFQQKPEQKVVQDTTAKPPAFEGPIDNLNTTTEYMDISYNDSGILEKSLKVAQGINKSEIVGAESDGEFVDCESTFNKNESQSEQSFLSEADEELIGAKTAEDNDENASIETLNDKTANLSAVSTDTTKTVDNKSESPISPLPQASTLQPLPDIAQETELLLGNTTFSEVRQVLDNNDTMQFISKDDVQDQNTGVANNSDANILSELASFILDHESVNLVNNDLINTPNIDNVGVKSLSQIPLIVDPRVLLFNIPTSSDGKEKETSDSDVMNTSPADVPLPDDDDLESMTSLPVNENVDKKSENITLPSAPLIIGNITQLIENTPEVADNTTQVTENTPNKFENTPHVFENVLQNTEDIPQETNDIQEFTVNIAEVNQEVPQVHQQVNVSQEIETLTISAMVEVVDAKSLENLQSDHAEVNNVNEVLLASADLPQANISLQEETVKAAEGVEMQNVLEVKNVPEKEKIVQASEVQDVEPMDVSMNNASIPDLNSTKLILQDIQDVLNVDSFIPEVETIPNGIVKLPQCIKTVEETKSLLDEISLNGNQNGPDLLKDITMKDRPPFNEVVIFAADLPVKIDEPSGPATDIQDIEGIKQLVEDIVATAIDIATDKSLESKYDEVKSIGQSHVEDERDINLAQNSGTIDSKNITTEIADVTKDLNLGSIQDIDEKNKTLDLADDIITITSNVEKETKSQISLIPEEIAKENLLEDKNVFAEIDKKNEDFPEQKDVSLNDELETVAHNNPNFDSTKTKDQFETSKIGTEIESEIVATENDIKTTLPALKVTETPAMDITPQKGKQNESLDEEVVVSENNSPFVLVNEIASQEKGVESFEDIVNPFATKIAVTPPASPKIVSKGYNFNFDEIDDPFATKTKIRVSPPPEGSPNQSFEQIDVEKEFPKKYVNKNNRRKSQPERKIPANNRKMNSTFAGKSIADAKFIPKPDVLPASINKKVNATIKSDLLKEVSEKQDTVIKDTKVEDIDIKVEQQNTTLSLEEVLKKDDSKLSIEISNTNKENKETSSSEQSAYYSAGTSSVESEEIKGAMKIPDTEDPNFNPFATESKIRQSPLPEDLDFNPFARRSNIRHSPPPSIDTDNPFATKSKIRKSPESSMVATDNDIEMDITQIDPLNEMPTIDKKEENKEKFEEKDSSGVSDITCSSKTGKDDTIREINTEDEDTVEGPFLESEELNNDDKMSDFDGENVDMMQFSELQPEHNEPGEIFIDAEAFDFLLNQNKCNTVSDSGKESLFLKFDPLFAKRISSDGVVSALKQVQKRQSTPKKTKPLIRDETFDKSPVAGPSTHNVTEEMDINNTSEDSCDNLNVTVAKPMMVVNPAVNPVVTPRNKTITPVRSNRQSLTFTSPAIAVIDRLLSMSNSNNSLTHDTTVAEVSTRDNEADLALTQLRELLADKEISVYNLRTESKELKERLQNLETQMKSLEAIGEERLKKINDLTEKLDEKTKHNKSMAKVVEEYERTIASLIAEKEQEKRSHAEERIQLIKERDEQTAHLASMEVSFSDLHSKYEKSKQIILGFKANEDTCKKSIKEFEENLTKMQNNYELLKQHATSKLNHANEELQKINRAHEAEVLKLNAMIKRKELHITSLEETLQQKTKANEELTAICDELINKVG